MSEATKPSLPPLAVNAKLFAHHAPNAADANDAVSQSIVAAGKALEATYARVSIAFAAHMANPLHTKAANLKRSADFADNCASLLAHEMLGPTQAISSEIDVLEKKVNAPLALPSEPGTNYSVTAQQIREHFAKLPIEQRQERAMRAVREKDTVTLGALLNAPGYLSGMDVEDSKTGKALQPLLREAFRQIHYAPDLARLERLRTCRDMLRRGYEAVDAHVAKLHPADVLTQAAKLDKAAREASTLADKFV